MRQPGAQNPGAYPFVGSNYQYWGEQPGYKYNPYGDYYFPDVNAANEYWSQQGYGPPKKPDLVDQLKLPAAVAVGTGFGEALGQGPTETIKGVAGGLGDLWDWGSGLLGGEKTVAPVVEATGPSGTGSGVGLLGGQQTAQQAASQAIPQTPITGQAVSQLGGQQAAGGLLEIGAGEAIPAGYEAVGTSQTGGQMIAQAGAGEAPGLLGGAMQQFGSLGYGPQAGIIAGTYLTGKGLYDLFTGDETKGTTDWLARGQTALSTFGFSEVARALGIFGDDGLFGSGKDADQRQRDQIRGSLQANNLIDENYQLTLADGSTFDVGREEFQDSVPSLGEDAAIYTLPWETNQNTGDVVGLVAPLATILSEEGAGKRTGDLTMMYGNAALSNAATDESGFDTALANVQKFYADAGLDANQAKQQIQRLVAEEKLTQEQAAPLYNAVDTVFGIGAYADGRDRRQAPQQQPQQQPEQQQANPLEGVPEVELSMVR